MRSFIAMASMLSLSASQDADVSQFEFPFALHADSKMNWTEANHFCVQQYGTGLASIQDSDEAETAMQMMQAANCGTGEARTRNTWIGLVQDEQSGDWLWEDGETCPADCIDLSFWRASRPVDDPERRCGVIWSGATANDEMLGNGWCDSAMCFLCRVDVELECPAGSTEVDSDLNDIGGCGLTGCDDRYTYSSAEECLSACNARSDCAAFTWAPMNGDKNHQGVTVCTLYSGSTPNQLWEPHQIMCIPGDDSVFESEAHKTCCIDGWSQGTDCSHGCWGCNCADGGIQCGCIHLENVDERAYLGLTTEPTAADIDDLRVAVMNKIDSFGNEDDGPESKPLIGSILRLVFHDCSGPFNDGTTSATNDNNKRLCDGCIDLDKGDHGGLQSLAVEPLEEICSEFAHIMNRADCWAAIGNVAIEYSHSLDELNDDPLPNLPYFFGREECPLSPNAITDNDEGTEFPLAHLGWDAMIQFFIQQLGFSFVDTVAILGAHTVGRAHKTASGFQGKWTYDSFAFNNEYYVNMLDAANQWDQEFATTDGVLYWTNLGRTGGDIDYMMLNPDLGLIAAIENHGFDANTGEVDCRLNGFTLFDADTCGNEVSFDLVSAYAQDNSMWLNDYVSAWNKLVTRNQPELTQVNATIFVDWRGVFESEAQKTCCLDGWAQGTDCQHGCWNCQCSDGGHQCGCIHLDNVDETDLLELTGDADTTANAHAAFTQYLRPNNHPHFMSQAEQNTWTLTLSVKDLAILVLVVINLVTIVAVYCQCVRARGRKTTKNQVVKFQDSEMDSEEVALQR